jgi:hypothetical protein
MLLKSFVIHKTFVDKVLLKTLKFGCDALPSPLLDPSWVRRNHKVELFGIWGTLPASNTKRGRGAC